jgi:hypothetical protein
VKQASLKDDARTGVYLKPPPEREHYKAMKSEFKNPLKSYRPMVGWWWLGMDVNKEELLKAGYDHQPYLLLRMACGRRAHHQGRPAANDALRRTQTGRQHLLRELMPTGLSGSVQIISDWKISV